jgi:hypothetical protein
MIHRFHGTPRLACSTLLTLAMVLLFAGRASATPITIPFTLVEESGSFGAASMPLDAAFFRVGPPAVASFAELQAFTITLQSIPGGGARFVDSEWTERVAFP